MRPKGSRRFWIQFSVQEFALFGLTPTEISITRRREGVTEYTNFAFYAAV